MISENVVVTTCSRFSFEYIPSDQSTSYSEHDMELVIDFALPECGSPSNSNESKDRAKYLPDGI
jgi:hypothetical protein